VRRYCMLALPLSCVATEQDRDARLYQCAASRVPDFVISSQQVRGAWEVPGTECWGGERGGGAGGARRARERADARAEWNVENLKGPVA